jgi:uncharacterized membrane protein
VGSWLTESLTAGDPNSFASFMIQAAYVVGSYALSFWLTLGQTKALIGVARDRPATFGEVFQGGRFFARYLGAFVLLVLFMFPLSIVCILPAAFASAVASNVESLAVRVVAVIVGVLVGAVVFIVVAVRVSMFPYVLVDRDCSVIDSLQTSYQITRGRVGEMFLTWVLSWLIAVSGVFACCVGLLVTAPLGWLVAATAYVLLTGTPPSDAPRPLQPDIEFLDFQP